MEKTNHFALVNLRTAAPTVCVSVDPQTMGNGLVIPFILFHAMNKL